MRRTDVVIAHRHPIVLEGLSIVLGALSDFRIVASCENTASCIEAIKNFAPDIAIVDPAMPECAELLLRSTHISQNRLSESRSTHVVFFGSSEDCARVLEAAPATCSIVLKDAEPEALLQFMRRIAEGEGLSPTTSSDPIVSQEERADADHMLATLTDRERQIMHLVSKGLSNKEIGRRLNIADGTIKQHLHKIFQKLAVSNRTVLAAIAIAQYGRATMDNDKMPEKNCG
ncbi:LuxR C-terminal-related transcriptional regulator [Bradyrhizobium sp. GCM10027634]|uniref:LuxR C-terminal-related transcriptional regulator n=1 Tax=unclassified Bradyrhizobium TaxID=2631580 RepID=UPI00263B322D|nr:response regulator transcription factor [Bradyrhizobium sp. WYCCWR 12677]MDN5001402.1 response regulator transcription factor [Bradyrhizobium sp. WYCCWR 12677]